MSRFSSLEFESAPENESQQLANAPRDEVFYLKEAQDAFERGDFEKALRAFARVLEYNASNPRPWSGQVRMLIELGEFREAKLWADKALERFPRDPELLAAKAVALARLGDLKAALAFSDASFEERGDTPYIWIARGDVLLAREETRAEYCFEKAASLSPTSWLTRWLVSRVYYFYERFALALKAAQEGLERDAAQTVLWLQIALCQRQLGFVGAAAGSVERALELDPMNAAALAAQDRIGGTNVVERLIGLWKGLFRR